MNNDRRREVYLRGGDLTPAQSRRLRHKEHAAMSERVTGGLGRYARLKRRFERREARVLRVEARNVVWWIRLRRAAKQGSTAARSEIREIRERA